MLGGLVDDKVGQRDTGKTNLVLMVPLDLLGCGGSEQQKLA